MLPFLKNKDAKQTGVMIKTRQSDDIADEHDDPKAGIKACARELIEAIHSRSEERVSEALSDIFAILDSEPHEEGEHTNSPSPHSYDAQNIKAGE